MESFKLLLDLHTLLGGLLAKLEWVKCSYGGFFEGTVASFENKVKFLKTRIDNLLDSVGVFECQDLEWFEKALVDEKEKVEAAFELEHRPGDLVFNKRALFIYTNKIIPIDVQIALSFGYKFLFPYLCTDDNLFKLLAQLEMTVEQSVPVCSTFEVSSEIQRILKNQSLSDAFNDTLSWLKFVSYRTKTFFERNPDLIAVRTDKGCHTAVMSLDAYHTKLGEHLSDNVYISIELNPLKYLIDIETELVDLLFALPATRTFGSRFLFQPNILTLAKFYGLPKIHKNNVPLRPITSTVNSPGYFLGKVFYQMLDVVFPRTTHHIKDSYEFVEFINQATILCGDILVSFDVISMYTSIPFDLMFNIIMRKANVFFERFGISRNLLSKILIFLLVECSVFMALDKVYIQRDGLPMGSCLSPLIARIFMDEVINTLLCKVPVSFIKVFVDDTIAAIQPEMVEEALAVLNGFAPDKVKFTLERENDNRSINFLNVTLTRENDSVIPNWFCKPFSSGRLVNYYSSHKRATIVATAAHFIKTVLILSDPRYYHQNRSIIVDKLRLNSFPEILIITLMNTFYTFMRPINCDVNKASVDKYVIFPHAISESKKIRNTVYKFMNSGIALADSVKNTKINFISSGKMTDPVASGGNVVLNSTCKCKDKCIIGTTEFGESGRMALKRLKSRKERCDRDGHCFRYFSLKRGLYYNCQTKYLLRYMQWIYRHKLDASSCQYHFPLFNFCKLAKCKCCN